MAEDSLSSTRSGFVERVNARFFYGWVIVGVAAFGVFSSGPGQSHTFSAFIEPISAELQISSATIATAYGLATLAAAFMLPYMGRLIDRYGPRTMMFAIVGAVGAACLFFAASPNFIWLAIGFGLLRFFGQGSLMLVCANLVSQWFSRTRGVAMSLMALGFGMSMAIHPPLSQFLIDWVGWRQAWIVLSLFTWATMLPAIWFLVHNTPEGLGLRPDGDAREDAAGAPKPAAVVTGMTLDEALKTPTFYILSLGFCAIAMLVTTLHFYQVTILTDQGLSRANAASIFAISAITMVVAMPLVGRIFDTVKTRYVIATALFVTATSLVLMTFATTLTMAVVYAVCFGLNNALSMTMFGYIWPRYFGRKHLGSVQGTGQLVGVVGASLGPLPVGIAYDLVGNATATLIGLAIFPAVAGVITLLFLRTPPAVEVDGRLE
ncbi:MAG: MFS transporter [Pseudomonadota bacterium]